ncbi:MAG: phenylalanine--tRNA ligase subunit alpha [Alphaproteobacteria bacterium]|nr:phenylalanine--tRNA ligase subunit alpha [Alphaproteobacteria bacterium]
MSDTLENLKRELLESVHSAQDLASLDEARVAALGKKGRITAMMKDMGSLSPEERKTRGQAMNAIKQAVTDAIDARKDELGKAALQARLEQERIDVSLPVRPQPKGRIHPLSQVVDEVIEIFGAMGFEVAEGPDIEDDWHNFEALNFPPDHPARQEHDTFYMPDRTDGSKMVLRTHTSPVQIRHMLENKPPIRAICPGRTFRSDHDATHSPMFHQVEGLVVGKDIHMGHLKGCLIDFCRTFFGVDDLPVRFRPSYFPFTEPSAEVDIGCSRKGGGLTIGHGDDWLEILGSGMVHPNVLKAGGIDPAEYQGFAFGMGIERIAMLKYGIPDLRPFYDSDVRWLGHYGFRPEDIPSTAAR